jgi:hypothetical protein
MIKRPTPQETTNQWACMLNINTLAPSLRMLSTSLEAIHASLRFTRLGHLPWWRTIDVFLPRKLCWSARRPFGGCCGRSSPSPLALLRLEFLLRSSRYDKACSTPKLIYRIENIRDSFLWSWRPRRGVSSSCCWTGKT